MLKGNYTEKFFVYIIHNRSHSEADLREGAKPSSRSLKQGIGGLYPLEAIICLIFELSKLTI